MSEKILKALMQLFAIIARPNSSRDDRKVVVESFLKRQLNNELIREYLKVFDEFYTTYQEKQKEGTKKQVRLISASSVRVLKICTAINEELEQSQKIIVLIQLLEFVKSDSVEITDQEMAFLNTVAETFNIPEEEYGHLRDFVLFSFNEVPSSEDILIIDNKQDTEFPNAKHMSVPPLQGQLRILLVPNNKMYFVRYFGGSEMYLNSQLIQEDKVYVFTNGSSIRNQQIKPIYYSDVVSRFQIDKLKEKIVFEVRDIEYRFKGGKIGLHKMSFTEESGSLIGIMGASGAGKSTLLNVLNGSTPPSSGEILINGVDIFKDKKDIEGIIGHVSQDDLLIEDLTVFQNLYYNAKLCFDNYTEEQIIAAVNQTLENLGLFEIKDIQVGSPLNKKISGGQRKRLNIALELIREPAVLFLDEPTSGLSSRDSENILDLLKELSLKGKLVYVVIHQPSSEIFKMFDKLIVLDTGGWLIYSGPPVESIIYFKERIHHANWNESECHCCGNVTPEQVFNIVEANVLDEYGNATKTRKITPAEWHHDYLEFQHADFSPPEQYTSLPKIQFKIPNKLRQFLIFVRRDVLSKLSNTQYLVINFVEAPVLALLLSYIIKYYNVSVTNKFGYFLKDNSNLPVYIFMSVIVAIFMGLTVSAEEIIKDRKIKKREAFLNLSWSSYLLSKVAVLFAISALQALTYVLLGNTIMEIRGMYFHYWLVLFSAWTSSILMGLVISDSFKTVVTIYILIPFLVIPQIILSGVMVKFDKLNPKISSPIDIPWYGEIWASRWAYEAAAVYQFKDNRYSILFYKYWKAKSIAQFRQRFWITEIKNRIDYVEKNSNNPENREEMLRDLRVLRNEITKENRLNNLVKFEDPDRISEANLNLTLYTDLRDYLDRIKSYYNKLNNKASEAEDNLKTEIQKGPDGTERLRKLERDYHNKQLEDFATSSDGTNWIIEYHDHLYQKYDPVYLDPQQKFIKAHFYAPRKQLFGRYYDTYWVNILVLWFMSIVFYIILYFRLLKKFLDSMEQLSDRINLGSKE
jgi:ABC-type multidrug transport system ATPase subunit